MHCGHDGRKKMPIPILGPRVYDHENAIVKIFRRRYTAKVSVDWTSEDIEDLLNGTNNMETGQQAIQRHWKKTHQLSWLQFLSSLQNVIMNENSKLNYQHLKMHYQCMYLLYALKMQLHDRLVEYLGPKYPAHEDQIVHLVGYILIIALESQRARSSTSKARRELLRAQILRVTTTTIEDAI